MGSDDIGDQVSPERRRRLNEQSVAIDAEIDAVRRQPGLQALGQKRREFATERRGADEDDLGAVGPGHACRQRGVALDIVVFQGGVIDHVDDLGAVGDIFPHVFLQIMPYQHRRDAGPDGGSQIPCPRQELKRHPVLKIVPVVAEDPYLPAGVIHRPPRSLPARRLQRRGHGV